MVTAGAFARPAESQALAAAAASPPRPAIGLAPGPMEIDARNALLRIAEIIEGSTRRRGKCMPSAARWHRSGGLQQHQLEVQRLRTLRGGRIRIWPRPPDRRPVRRGEPRTDRGRCCGSGGGGAPSAGQVAYDGFCPRFRPTLPPSRCAAQGLESKRASSTTHSTGPIRPAICCTRCGCPWPRNGKPPRGVRREHRVRRVDRGSARAHQMPRPGDTTAKNIAQGCPVVILMTSSMRSTMTTATASGAPSSRMACPICKQVIPPRTPRNSCIASSRSWRPARWRHQAPAFLPSGREHEAGRQRPPAKNYVLLAQQALGG